MGMYCEVYGVEIKMTGLLAHAATEVLGDLAVVGGIAEFSREEVQEIVGVMRMELLDGWANKAVFMSEYLAEQEGEGVPLSNMQDIMHFASDVHRFERLCLWLTQTREERLVFA